MKGAQHWLLFVLVLIMAGRIASGQTCPSYPPIEAAGTGWPAGSVIQVNIDPTNLTAQQQLALGQSFNNFSGVGNVTFQVTYN
jgi:hypothetical protein